MARIGKTMIMNVIENEFKKEADVVYDGNVIGRISTQKGAAQETTELYINKFYKSELVKETELLLATFGVVFDRSVKDEGHIVFLLNTLQMLNDLEETYHDISEATKCTYCLLISYKDGGVAYLPASNAESLEEIENIMRKDSKVEFTLIIDKHIFDIQPDRHLTQDYILMHLCS